MQQSRDIVVLLPIKKNSARVINKNFRSFSGRPLFSWILDCLLSLEWIDLILINTDARQLIYDSGFQQSDRILIRDRDPDICGDEISMNKVIANDLDFVNANSYLMTHATNPLLSAKTIKGAYRNYLKGVRDGRSDSLLTVTRRQTRFYLANGDPVNHDPNDLLPTQDLTPWYEENSCLYIFSKASFSRTQSRIGDRPILHSIPLYESVDIDDEESWQLAEMLHQRATSPPI